MAKKQRHGQVMKRGTRRAMGRRVVRPVRRVQVTLGELIAAAFDVVGGEARKVARVMASPAMAQATGRQFIVVG